MDFQYVSRPIRGPGCSREWEESLQGCACDGPCTAENKCSCLLANEFSAKPILECHFECSCSPSQCSNRVLQKGVAVKLKVVQTGSKGYGIRAMEFIPINTFVCEYAGEVIDEKEANRRFMTNKTDHNYIMTIKETCLGKTVTYYIDPREKGNLARFLNHSCEPNLYQMTVRVGCPIPRMGFFALKDISPGEELSYSYGTLRSNGTKKCLCGATACLGFLPSDL